MLRFRLAKILNQICDGTLMPVLQQIVHDRTHGAVLLSIPSLHDPKDTESMLQCSTAIAHMIGRSSLDQMSGKFYARFVVVYQDNSDSYLRQGGRVLELHTDGTYVDECPDFVLMQKIDEQNVTGGESILLHLDDWQDLTTFTNNPLGWQPLRFSAPPSKNVKHDVWHSIFKLDANNQPTISYIDQFVQPDNFSIGNWLCDLSHSLENDPKRLFIPYPAGGILLINNHFWLHGRDKFTMVPNIRRELARQRGTFF